MLRRTAALAALTLAASLAATVNSSAQAADPTLVVPESPSGDVTVTASADPATAPYLQIRIVRGTSPVAPYDGIAPAPVANAGGTVDVAVPTWGFGSTTTTFVLLGCAAADPSSCTALLASVQRMIVQTELPSATLELPETDPIFFPEDETYVTAQNEGGGRVDVYFSNWHGSAVRFQEVEPGVRTLFTAFPPDMAGTGDLRLRRCSAISTLPVCEPASSLARVSVVGAPLVWTLSSDQNSRPFTVNPAWSGSTRTYASSVFTESLPYDLSWELRKVDGERVAGPVQVLDDATDPFQDITVSPGKETGGALADSSYDLVLTASITRGGITKSGTLTRRIAVVNNPPAEQATLLSAQRVIRPDHLASPELPSRYPEARFRVRGPNLEGEGKATLVVRTARGHVVAREPAWHQAELPRRDWIARWSGNRSDGLMSNSGTYQAELVLPDSFGRSMVKKLGPIYLETTSYATRSVWVTPSTARVRTGRFVGSCSRVRAPGPFRVSGSVGLLSLDRCRSQAGTRDVVQQTFSAKIPWTGPSADVDAYTVEGGARVDVAGMNRRGINRSPAAQVACRLSSQSSWPSRTSVAHWNQWEYALCERTLPDGDHRGKSILIRVRVHGGVRLDVRRFRVQLHYRVWRRVA